MKRIAAIGTGQLGQLTDQLADVGDDQTLDHLVESELGRRFGQARGQPCGRRGRTGEVLWRWPSTDLGQVDGCLIVDTAGRSWVGPPDGTVQETERDISVPGRFQSP